MALSTLDCDATWLVNISEHHSAQQFNVEATTADPDAHDMDATEPLTAADPNAIDPDAIDMDATEPVTASDPDAIDMDATEPVTASDPDAIAMDADAIGPNTIDPDTTDSNATEANGTNSLCRLSDSERHKENKRLCKLRNFPAPMSRKAFRERAWTFVETVQDKLQPGYRFLTLQELSSVRRTFTDPFCWPGPLVRNDLYCWHLADSIVQEVYLKSDVQPYYVVRWRGFEDQYNTVEPKAYVVDTAIYTLFTKPKMKTACGMSGCAFRKSERKVKREKLVEQMIVKQTRYELAMGKLASLLSIEEKSGRYCPTVGFYSYVNVIEALKIQHTFLFEKFAPIVREFGSAVRLGSHYIGIFCGNVSKAAEFKEVSPWQTNNKTTIKDLICGGLSASNNSDTPCFVTFFAPKKFDTAEKKNKSQMKFHMAVFTVRSLGGVKDAIYFDPSPFNRSTSTTIDGIRAPKFNSFTKSFGVPSENNDCVFQCMEYIIGLSTGRRTFEPDLSKPARRLDQLMQERATKKRKI